MIDPGRRRRIVLGLWILVAVVAWNGLYDLRISLGVREYLLKQTLHEAGQGPAVTMSDAMRATVADAVLVATSWAALLVGAALWTIRTLSRREPASDHASAHP